MGRVEALCNRNLMNEDFLQHYASDSSIRKTEILCMVISHSFMKMSKSLLYAGESMDNRLRTEWKM